MKALFQSHIIFIIAVLVLASCKSGKNPPETRFINDSVFVKVQAYLETDHVPGSSIEDAADDPAIWYNESDPSGSLILGTDKKGGIMVFDLNGKLLKYHNFGLPNNIDIRRGFRIGDRMVDIAGFSNRKDNTIEIYHILPDGNMENLLEEKFNPLFTGEVYGFCLFHCIRSGAFYAIINSKKGDIEQWLLDGTGGSIIPKLAKSLKTSSQPEGMVADDEQELLFVGEEDKGIWSFDISSDRKREPYLITSGNILLNKALKDDIEGLTIYYKKDGGYLLASSQGNNSYAVFNRLDEHEYIGSFRITDGIYDGTEETDGIDVLNLPLNESLPTGIFIAHDGSNKQGLNESQPQNFKFVSWEKIAKSLCLD